VYLEAGMSDEPVWEYCFATWPEETSPRWNRAAFKLWDSLKGFMEMEFTERQFNDFREDLAKCGISLREITRRPHVRDEIVSS
jgi:hypothetical protein